MKKVFHLLLIFIISLLAGLAGCATSEPKIPDGLLTLAIFYPNPVSEESNECHMILVDDQGDPSCTSGCRMRVICSD